MPCNVSSRDIFESCVEGIRAAEDLYINWSGSYSVRFAPESLAQVEIARSIFSRNVPYVTLEEPVRSILGYNPGNNRITDSIRTGRVDIVVWHGHDPAPRILIEVKKINSNSSIDQDAHRLKQLATVCQRVQFGIVVGYSMAVKQETLKKRFKNASNGYRLEQMITDIKSSNTHGDDRYLGIACYKVGS